MMITCPCCHGQKRVTVVEHDDDTGRTILTRPQCTHCMGMGEVEAEAPRDDAVGLQGTIGLQCPGAVGTPGLRKFELSRAAKKDHLLALRMAPDEVEKVLTELYGSTP